MVVKQFLYALLCDFLYCLCMFCGWTCVMVDMVYPGRLHDSHSGFPLAA